MKIRQALDTDLSSWSKMRTHLWPDTDDGHLAELMDYFNGQSNDVEQAFIAEVDDEIIGFLELNIRNFAEGSREPKVPYVEGWYIKPEFENNGYGTALMKHAEQWALSLGYSELASDTEVDNNRSIELHKKLGFKETERVVCFLKNLKT